MNKTMKIMLEEGAVMPSRAHKSDAGYDLYVPVNASDISIKPKQSVTINTGVHVAIPEGYVGFIKSKSGLNIKYGLVCEGVIDSGYTGAIVVKMYNNNEFAYNLFPGDKLTQIVFLPIYTPDLISVDTLDKTERGDNGFGSTGI